MILAEKQNLIFFDKHGNQMNFTFDNDRSLWIGKLYFPRVSSGLYETLQIFIFDKIRSNGNAFFGKYQSDDVNQYVTEFWYYWENNTNLKNNEIFLYEINTNDDVEKVNFITEETDELNFYSTITGGRKNVTNFDTVGACLNE